MSTSPSSRVRRRIGALAFAIGFYGLLVTIASCAGDDGASGADGQDGTDAPVPLTRADPLPGFNLVITSISGGSGAGGNFVAGDTVSVTFTANDDAGDPIDPADWAFDEFLFAGPIGNIHRLLNVGDVINNSVMNSDGSYTFTSPTPLPATIPQQINEAISTIPWETGALSGQALPTGVYLVGMSLRQNVEVEGRTFRDATSVTQEVMLDGAASTFPNRRELITDANCNNCHTEVRFHGGNRRGVVYCQMCHTNGSVSSNSPGESLSLPTMLHKVHSGRHLPSVNGKTVDVVGDPVYGPGVPYVLGSDYSLVAFPQWPHLSQGMPKDTGYDLLGGAEQDVEDAILGGPTNCNACHGDPGGGDPAPADGDLIFSSEIVTRACIGCHDDWDPALPYTANGQTMPAGLVDGSCTFCHGESSALDVRKSHTHPLLDTTVPPLWGPTAGAIDLTFDVTAVSEVVGASDGDGVVEPGEKLEVTVDIVDGMAAAVDPADLDRVELVIAGPIENPNTLYTRSLSGSPAPSALLPGAGPSHTFIPYERWELEIAAMNTPTEYQTARAPHYPTQYGATNDTLVFTVPTPVAGGTTTTAEVLPYQNYIDVVDATGLAGGDVVVIDDATPALAEYLTIRAVQNNRLWFSAPLDVVAIVPAKQHAAGAQVVEVTPAPAAPTLDDVTGILTFGVPPVDRVLVSYTTDFVVPMNYTGAINNSPSLDPMQPIVDERVGEWTRFSMEDGTYFLGFYGEVGFDVDVTGGGMTQITSYQEGAQGDTITTFRLGSAGALDPYDRVTIGSCIECHRDIQFHGAHRRGIQNCVLCHGVSGAEDWPQFKTGGLASAETPGTTIDFREMLHKIHRGRDLADAENYTVVGFFGRSITFEEVGFPDFVGGTANCDSCHGPGNTAWYAPTDRLHPSQAFTAPQSNWNLVCSSCHDDRAAMAHIESNTSASGLESCAVCHGTDKELSVELVHRNLVR